MAHDHGPRKLVLQLCRALNAERIAYCHWKSNNALARSASGDNDLDLLVSRRDIPRFLAILSGLGFKEAMAEAEKRMIGVADFYGFDADSGTLIHVHAHYQLVLGHDLTKNYRLPIEEAYLASSALDGIFKVPAPEYEFVVLVVRLMLKHATWDVALREGRLKPSEKQELAYLGARIDWVRVDHLVSTHLPSIGVRLFRECWKGLQPGASIWRRLKAGGRLQSRLRAHARRSALRDVCLKPLRRWSLKCKRRVFRLPARHRLSSGGAMIAIVGGDGAGKTTLVTSLHEWLSHDLDTKVVHMGKPRESLFTALVRATLRVGHLVGLYPHHNSSSLYLPESKSPNYPGKTPWMLREACKARDRYRTYRKARRFVNNGCIVICDRYPLRQIRLMDGPVVEQLTSGGGTRFSGAIMEFERRYYQAMTLPELVIVLRLDPEEAVRRKTDEDSTQVRVRSTEIWNIDWAGCGVEVIEAQQSPGAVLAAAKSLIWSTM